MEKVLFILAVLMMLSYITAVSLKSFSIPGSISASFYALKHKIWFFSTMTLPPLLILVSLIDHCSIFSSILLLAGEAGMSIVGYSPDYKTNKKERIRHIGGATIACVSYFLWVAINGPVFLSVWILYIVYTLLYTFLKHRSSTLHYRFMKSKPMFWVEVATLASTILCGFKMLFF